MAYLHNGDHCGQVRSCLVEMLTNDHYWNIIVFCSDGALAHNRMIIGLIFPELTDEITVICPDYTVQDLTDTISKILDIKEAGSEVERMVVSHVVDTDTHVFTPADMDNICHEDENNSGNGEDPLQMDVEASSETDNAQVDTDTTNLDPYQLSCDSKIELKPHLEALCQKSPEKPVRRSPFKVSPDKPVRKSPFKRIKLKRARNITPRSNSLTRQDDQVVKNLMDDLLEKINEDENQPSNLVFSTLGLSNVNPSSPESHNDDNDDDHNDHNNDHDDDDDISAYLNSSREASPDRSESPESEFVDNVPLESELSPNGAQSVDSDSNSLSSGGGAKIRNFNVEIERLRVNEVDRKVMRNYIEKRRENRIKKLNECRKSQRNRDRKEIDSKHKKSKKRFMPVKKLRKPKRCYECDTCKIPDCRKCLFCKDMKKYGGKGFKKQACMMRPKCLVLLNNPGKKISKTVKPPTPVTLPETKKIEASKNICKKSKHHNRINVKISGEPSQEPINNERAKLQKFKSLNSENVIIRQNKIKEIKRKFREQEEKAMSGKVDMTNLSREELLFGFYL